MHNEESELSKKLSDPIFSIILRRKKDALTIFVGVILGISFEWSMVEIAIFLVFIWSIIGPIQSRYLACSSLFFLCFTPILLVIDRKVQAEEFAIYAYYFLVMTVIRGIIEIRKKTKETESLSRK